MITLVITNRKGGVGKTTTTTNVSACLGQLGKRVLVIDLDTQSNLQYGFGFNEPFKEGIHNCMLSSNDLSLIIYKTQYENVSLIPADVNFDISQLNDDKSKLKILLDKYIYRHHNS